MSMKKKPAEEEYAPSRLVLKSSPPTKKQQKLSEQFVMRVLSEEESCRKHMTEESILALLNDYKKLVEYYSSRQDSIALYFTEKMQNLIACQAAIEMLDKSQEVTTMSMVEEAASQPPLIQDFKEVNWSSPSRYDIESKRKERSKKVQITLEVKKTHKRSNARNILNKYYDECVENNLLVMNEIQLQKKDLQDRLRAIHQNSLKLPIEQLEQQQANSHGLGHKTSLEVYIS